MVERYRPPTMGNVAPLKERIKELEQLVSSFVAETIDYANRNNLGDPEKQHNVKWARKLGLWVNIITFSL